MKPREEDDAATLLKKILSPADAQSLVMPPPDHPPQSGPAESTPLTGNLAAPPSQATPSRDQGLAGYFAAQPHDAGSAAGRGAQSQFVKVSSQGQVGYLPRANLARAQQIDRDLKVLED